MFFEPDQLLRQGLPFPNNYIHKHKGRKICIYSLLSSSLLLNSFLVISETNTALSPAQQSIKQELNQCLLAESPPQETASSICLPLSVSSRWSGILTVLVTHDRSLSGQLPSVGSTTVPSHRTARAPGAETMENKSRNKAAQPLICLASRQSHPLRSHQL